jgi:hypothetical protein
VPWKKWAGKTWRKLGKLRKNLGKIDIDPMTHGFGYESKPWYPSEPQITGKWMFIPPNIARLVLIHPHLMKTSTFLDYRGLSHDFPYIFP